MGQERCSVDRFALAGLCRAGAECVQGCFADRSCAQMRWFNLEMGLAGSVLLSGQIWRCDQYSR
jgi:hypothetical protein